MNHSSAAILLPIYLALLTTTAFALDPHVEAVTRIVEAAKGKVEKTADGQSLKSVDLAVPNAGPHDHRKDDPYDAAFFEHLSHIPKLESLNVISTKANDEWIAPLGKLTNLKTLRFTNNGKLTDAGMATFAGLKNLESFAFVGTAITGQAYAKCTNWSKVTKVSHRGSSIDDEGLKQLCEHLPSLESISLAHAKFTDAGAAHLAKLTKLKGLEIGTKNATPACLKHLASLPLEYLQLGDGLDAPEGIAACKAITSLKRLTLTHCEKLDDNGLKLAATLTQLDQLEIGGLLIPDERIPQLAAFAHLKELKLINRPKGYPPETKTQIKALLPKVEVKFQ
ncbi:MAG: G protein-coupled receptor LGR4 [Verrucomicrobiaceae bacterium]|nr:G protein-coupled receptor LGR4 [Verrucomicrobiaceae bacterium]